MNAVCPLCSHARTGLLWQDDLVWMRVCWDCDLCWAVPQRAVPSVDEIYDAEYFDRNYAARSAAERLRGERELERLERLQPPGRLLDVGCGLGIFAATAAERGWRVHAVEPSQLAASRARSLTGESVKLHVGGFLDLDLPEGSFDAITFWDVLAHLIDPKTAIAKAASLLAPGGVLVVRTPVRPRAFFFALRWFGAFHRLRASLVHFPMQSCHFQADGLARALRAGGFGEVVARREVRSVTTRATGSWILKHPRGFAYSEAERLARRVFPQESLTVRAKIAPRPIASADGIARSGERP